MTAGFGNTKIWVTALPGEQSVMCRIMAPPKHIHVLIPDNTFPANMTGQGRAKLKMTTGFGNTKVWVTAPPSPKKV